MHQVEELADRIALIDHGETVLYGNLAEIRRNYSAGGVLVLTLNELPASLPGVQEIRDHNSRKFLKLEPGKTAQDLLGVMVEKGIILEQFEIALPTLDEIFIQVVGNNRGAE